MGFLNKLFGIKSGMCGGNLRWELFLGTLTISGTGKIEWFAFDGFESLTSVIIGNSVTSIGNDVFRGCTSLTSVTIGNSVTRIGNGAFFSCIKLTNVTIPDSVMMIDNYAFSSCFRLTSVTIGNSVTRIGNGAFIGCARLTSVTIPESVTTIGDEAFYNCTSLKEIHYPAGRGFEKQLSQGNNAKLIPYTVTPTVQPVTKPIIQAAKSGTCGKNLRWKLDGDTLTISGTGKMDDYDLDTPTPWNSSRELIRHVMIADKVTTIGDRAFTSCESLTSVTIPDSVTTIGISAFSWCDNLKEIHYPAGRGFEKNLSQFNNAKLIPYNVATPVKSTTQPAKSGTQPTTQPSKSNTCGKNLRWKLDGSGTLTISGTGKMDDYYVDAKIAWRPSKESIKRVVIADGVTSIGDSAFYGCKSLTSVTIPDSVTTIGKEAFDGCISLTSVKIPDSVTTIGDYAFCSCQRLTSVTIPDSVTSIGKGAFIGTSLRSVTIPDSVMTIGEKPVYNCRSLKEIHYPAGRGFEKNLLQFNNAKLIPYNVATPVKSTTQPAKSGTQPTTQPSKSGKCGRNVTWLLSGDTLTISGTGKMDDYSYDAKIEWLAYRESIKRVVIADGVTSIGEYAFYRCKSLTSVTIPDSVTSIGEYAFDGCKSLTSVTIGNSGRNLWWKLDGGTLTISGTGKMDDYYVDAKIEWLSSKESIKRVIVADGVTSIGDSAFYECENLTSVTIGESVTTIGDYAFCSCQRLKSVTIGNSVTTIGNGAFSGTSLRSVTIPDSITTIGNGAFSGTSLRSVTIPDSITTIGISAFSLCDNLKEIHYPAGRGFETNLSQGNNAKLIPYNVATPVTKPTTQTVTQPKPTTQPVAEKLTWSFAGKTLTVGGVREIKFFPYGQIPWIKHLHDIQRIVVGDGVEKIAAQAFEECKRLELVTLPASVKTIGDMFASVCYCGDRFVNGGRNVFWCLEDGVLVLKKNPAAVGNDFSTGFASWIFADKNIHGVKLERGIKPTENFFAWLSSHDGAAISFG